MTKIAISLTPKGIDTVAFIRNKDAALRFYLLIERDMKIFEESVRRLVKDRGGELEIEDGGDSG